MNETFSKFLLAGDKFMPEIHLRQPEFTYSACGLFYKACFQHDTCFFHVEILKI